MFIHDRLPDPSWQADLESVIPRSDRVSWLKIVWQPGMPYEPVQRWELYELLPLEALPVEAWPADVMEDLRGVSPRHPSRGRFVSDPSVPGGQRWQSDSLVSLTQWRLFQETQCYAQRFWIIQGPHGGHPLKYTAAELNFRQSKGLGDAPAPGDLSYADYSHRVALKALACDKLRQWKDNLRWDQRSETRTKAGLYVRRDRYTEELQWSDEMMKWMDEEIAAVVSDLPRSVAAKLVGDAPVMDAPTEDMDALDHELASATASAPKGM